MIPLRFSKPARKEETLRKESRSKLPAFQDMGHTEVCFFGQRIVVGCVEGGEEETRRLARRLEADAGEVEKAVSAPIEPIQAALMVGILVYQQIEAMEKDLTAMP